MGRRWRGPDRALSGSRRKAGSNDGGFTLIELLLVLFIFSLTVTLAAASISSGLESVKKKTTARKIATLLTQARNQAISERKVFLARAEGGKVTIVKAGEKKPDRELAMPEGLSVTATDGGLLTAFYPQGSTSGGSIRLAGEGDELVCLIRVEPATGRVVVEGL